MIETSRIITWNNADVKVNFTFSAGRPGKYTGPYEDCYPDEEDEYEIESIIYEGVDVLPLFSETDYDAVIVELEHIRENENDC